MGGTRNAASIGGDGGAEADATCEQTKPDPYKTVSGYARSTCSDRHVRER
jgi:hypothetical protein